MAVTSDLLLVEDGGQVVVVDAAGSRRPLAPVTPDGQWRVARDGEQARLLVAEVSRTSASGLSTGGATTTVTTYDVASGRQVGRVEDPQLAEGFADAGGPVLRLKTGGYVVVDPSTGQVGWRSAGQFDGQVRYAQGGTVLVAGAEGLTARALDGSTSWSAQTLAVPPGVAAARQASSPGTTKPEVEAAAGDLVLLRWVAEGTFTPHRLALHDLRTGRLVVEFKTPTRTGATLAVDQRERLAVVGTDAMAGTADLSAGRVLWEQPTDQNRYLRPTSVGGGTIYGTVGTTTSYEARGEGLALDSRTGAARGGGPWSPPIALLGDGADRVAVQTQRVPGGTIVTAYGQQ